MNYQTKFLLKKGVLVQPKNLRTQSILSEITNYQSSNDQNIKYKRRSAIVPVPQKDDELINRNSMLQPIRVYQQEPKYIYEEEIKEKEYLEDLNYKRINHLSCHNFNQEQCQQLIDWMIKTVKRYQKTSYQTLFHCVELLDKFLCNTKGFIVDDLQLIGSCCIYLSSKFNDMYPICIEDMIIDICQETYTIHEFLSMEYTICRKLHYNIHFQTPFEYFEKIFFHLKPFLSQFYQDYQINNMKQNALELLQYSIIAYEFREITHYNKAIACIYEVIKTTDKIIIQNLLDLLNHLELNFNCIQLNAKEIKRYLNLNKEKYRCVNNYFY
ncbi:unnamed protein product [Paramecium primaurelia]|uniref:Cyclin-like domain-containing protein n=1 Tax=Paramecium primaurelia TaxID=5886 RepID=A0A8S1LGR6_PARPR|nr:unnamed protein product [Paramecium primaurelia]